MNLKRIWIVIALSLVLGLGLASCSNSTGTKQFTTAELATYDGLNGHKAYVAVSGKVYDVTNAQGWNSGSHQGVQAGQDLTAIITAAPHGTSVLKNLKIVGTLVN
jgi:predicted heme/steroid binding protein